MKTPKVRLYIRLRLSNGRYHFAEPIWNRNRTLKSGWGRVKGEDVYHSEAIYYLRFLRGSKRVWQSVGAETDRALTALQNVQLDFQSASLGRPVLPSSSIVTPAAQLTVSGAVRSYMAEIRPSRSRKTIAAAQHILAHFAVRFMNRDIGSITREDLLDHMNALQQGGLGKRTIHNHLMRINTLLRANAIVGLLRPADKPRYDERAVEAYDSDQLMALFAEANDEERLLFEFLLNTGFRDQEVMHATWRNVNFGAKVITAKSKPEYGFKLKDNEERSVPVPDALIASLSARKKDSTSKLIFPGPHGNPEAHFLRILKRVALRAGLNCGECTNKKGNTCAKLAICSQWGLHKFRKTFATMHNEAGVPAPTIQRWLGHSDLATTLRYLAVADLRSERTRTQVNNSFAVLKPQATLNPCGRHSEAGSLAEAALRGDLFLTMPGLPVERVVREAPEGQEDSQDSFLHNSRRRPHLGISLHG